MSPRDIALALLVPLIWGCNFVVMKYAVSEASPQFVIAARFLLAAVPLVFFIPRPAVSWWSLIGFSVSFGIIKFTILFWAFRLGAPAGVASVVLQMQAVMTVALAIVIFQERPTLRDVTGLAVATVGLLVIVWGFDAASGLTPVLMVLAAAVFWAIANLFMKSGGRFDPLAYAVWSSAIAAAIAVPLLFLTDGAASISATLTDLTPRGWGAMLYLAYPVSILSGAIWSHLMTSYPAAKVTPFALLTPAVGLFASSLVFGETITWTVIIGTAAICTGLAILMLKTRRPLAPPAAAPETTV